MPNCGLWGSSCNNDDAQNVSAVDFNLVLLSFSRMTDNYSTIIIISSPVTCYWEEYNPIANMFIIIWWFTGIWRICNSFPKINVHTVQLLVFLFEYKTHFVETYLGLMCHILFLDIKQFIPVRGSTNRTCTAILSLLFSLCVTISDRRATQQNCVLYVRDGHSCRYCWSLRGHILGACKSWK